MLIEKGKMEETLVWFENITAGQCRVIHRDFHVFIQGYLGIIRTLHSTYNFYFCLILCTRKEVFTTGFLLHTENIKKKKKLINKRR